MTERRLGRSIAAIVVAFIVVVVLSLATDEVLRLLKIYPALGQRMSDSLFALATGYRILYGLLGGYITARLAPYRPMLHSLIGGAIGTMLSALGAVASWRHPELGPHWYPVALVVTALPCAWLGARMYGDRKQAVATAN